MKRIKLFTLILGDILFFYASLLITLNIRYGPGEYLLLFRSHFLPFSAILIIWLATFYIFGLFDLNNFKNNLRFSRMLAAGLGVVFLMALAFFYLIPGIGIAPKTNLVLFIIIFGLLGYGWRAAFNSLIASGPPKKIAFIGEAPGIRKLVDYLRANPQLGYEIVKETKDVRGVIIHNVSAVVVPAYLKKDQPRQKCFTNTCTKALKLLILPIFTKKYSGRPP